MAAKPEYTIFTSAEIDTMISDAKSAIAAIAAGQSYTISSGGLHREVTRADATWLSNVHIPKLQAAKEWYANSSTRVRHTYAEFHTS